MVSLFSVCFFCRASQLGPSHRIRPKPRTSHRIASASQRIVFPRIIVNRLGSLPRSARPLTRTQRRRGGATAPWNIDFACGKKGGNKRTIVQFVRGTAAYECITHTRNLCHGLPYRWNGCEARPCLALSCLVLPFAERDAMTMKVGRQGTEPSKTCQRSTTVSSFEV